MNQKLGELYVGANVNPLAALLPTFAQIPIFISLWATRDCAHAPPVGAAFAVRAQGGRGWWGRARGVAAPATESSPR